MVCYNGLMEWIVVFIPAVLGLVLGSFVSAVSYRLPRGIGFVGGRSFCPRCRKQIGWFDNLPLISYFLLGGRCRRCKKPISVRYPLIELVTSVVFTLTGVIGIGCLPNSGFNLAFVNDYFTNGILCSQSRIFGLTAAGFYLLLLLITILISVIDWEHRMIPDGLNFLAFGLGTFYIFWFYPQAAYQNLLAGFSSGAFLYFLYILTKGRGMGLGDAKLAIFGGLILGVNAIDWLFLAFLTGAVTGIILIIVKKAGLKQKIAFGPFLALALWIEIVYGPVVLPWFGLNL